MPANITLQTIDGKHQAKNDGLGNLTAPIVFSDRQPTQSDLDMLDEQGWDEVLFLVDNNGVLAVEPTSIILHEDNNYCQYIFIKGHGAWSISGVDAHLITLDSSTGLMAGSGDARIDVEAVPGLLPGKYHCSFTVMLANGESVIVEVALDVSVPLTVNGEGNGKTVTLNLNADNNYTASLTVARDRNWEVSGVSNFGRIVVSPPAGDGVTLPPYTETVTVTKSPGFTEIGTHTPAASFDVVSSAYRVRVNVNIVILPPPFEHTFTDPPIISGEDIFIYI